MKPAINPLVIMVEELDRHSYLDEHDGHYVYIGGELIGQRPYDGSDDAQIADEVAGVLVSLIRERLRWDF